MHNSNPSIISENSQHHSVLLNFAVKRIMIFNCLQVQLESCKGLELLNQQNPVLLEEVMRLGESKGEGVICYALVVILLCMCQTALIEGAGERVISGMS
jgi:hypothetical protein